MKSLVKALIVMMAISFMGCDNGTTNGGGNENDPGNRVIAEQYQGTFEIVQTITGGTRTTTIVLGENTVTRSSIETNVTPPAEFNDSPFPAWTEGNTLRGQPPGTTVIHTLGTFTNADSLTGQHIFNNLNFVRVAQE